jgi:hypothetical protein
MAPIRLKVIDCPIVVLHGKPWDPLPSKPQIDEDGRHKSDVNGRPAYFAGNRVAWSRPRRSLIERPDGARPVRVPGRTRGRIMSALPIDRSTIRAHVELIHGLAGSLAERGKLVIAAFGEDPDQVDPKTGKADCRCGQSWRMSRSAR